MLVDGIQFLWSVPLNMCDTVQAGVASKCVWEFKTILTASKCICGWGSITDPVRGAHSTSTYPQMEEESLSPQTLPQSLPFGPHQYFHAMCWFPSQFWDSWINTTPCRPVMLIVSHQMASAQFNSSIWELQEDKNQCFFCWPHLYIFILTSSCDLHGCVSPFQWISLLSLWISYSLTASLLHSHKNLHYLMHCLYW